MFIHQSHPVLQYLLGHSLSLEHLGMIILCLQPNCEVAIRHSHLGGLKKISRQTCSCVLRHENSSYEVFSTNARVPLPECPVRKGPEWSPVADVPLLLTEAAATVSGTQRKF